MTKDRVWQPRCELSELFDELKLMELMAVARLRIIATFDHATEHYRGQVRGTDNYIGGLGSRQTDLVRHIDKNQKKPFVKVQDLPAELRMALIQKRRRAEQIADQAQHDIIALVVAEMCQPSNGHIWYDETHGLWSILPSVVDEYRYTLRRARRALKRDCRNEHGQVRSQRINRGRISGVSTSMANDTMVV